LPLPDTPIDLLGLTPTELRARLRRHFDARGQPGYRAEQVESWLYRRLARLRNHGMVRDADAFENRESAVDAEGEVNPWYYEMPEMGFNYRASDIHCALGLSQLGKLPKTRSTPM